MAPNDDSATPKLRGPPPGATEPPEHVKKPQVYEIFHSPSSAEQDGGRPLPSDPNANANPDGQGQQQQGGTRPPTLKDGVQSIKTDDFFNVHKVPCAREGFLTGIGGGATVGMLRYVIGSNILKSANWACGTFVIGSLLSWEYCRAKRNWERVAMARVTEVMDRKQAEKKAKAEEAARLRREAAEKAEQAKKSWYKFW